MVLALKTISTNQGLFLRLVELRNRPCELQNFAQKKSFRVCGRTVIMEGVCCFLFRCFTGVWTPLAFQVLDGLTDKLDVYTSFSKIGFGMCKGEKKKLTDTGFQLVFRLDFGF